MSTVSVILPLYNCEKYVAAAVDSVFRQDHANFELIVVDDGSTDASVQQLEPHLPRIRLITQQNNGVAAARNAGLKAARGAFLAFIDADDVWVPSRLSLQLAALKAFPGAGAAFSDFFVMNEEGQVQLETDGIHWKYGTAKEAEEGWTSVFETSGTLEAAVRPGNHRRLAVYEGNILARLFRGNFVNTSSILLRREIADSVGLFDETLSTEEDYDYWLRVASRTRFAFLDAPLVGFRRREGQITGPGQIEKILRNVETVIRRASPAVEPAAGRREIEKRLARIDRDIGELCLRLGRSAESRRRLLRSALSDPTRMTTHALLGLALLPPVAYRMLFGILRSIRRTR